MGSVPDEHPLPSPGLRGGGDSAILLSPFFFFLLFLLVFVLLVAFPALPVASCRRLGSFRLVTSLPFFPCLLAAMVLFPHIRCSLKRQLDVLLHLLLARSALDLTGSIPVDLATFNVDLCFEGASAKSSGWSAREVLMRMDARFVSWPTSPFVVASKKILSDAPAEGFDNLLLLLLCIMGTPAFAQLLSSSGLSGTQLSAQDKLARLLRSFRGHPASLVDRSTRAGRVLHGRLTGMKTRAEAKQALIHSIPLGLKRPQLKVGKRWRAKRTILSHIGGYPQFGPDSTSAFWQLFRTLYPTFPASVDKQFCETGPGARGGLNWLMGFPPSLGKASKDVHHSLLYADKLVKLGLPLARNRLLRPSAGDPARVAAAKRKLLLHLDGHP